MRQNASLCFIWPDYIAKDRNKCTFAVEGVMGALSTALTVLRDGQSIPFPQSRIEIFVSPEPLKKEEVVRIIVTLPELPVEIQDPIEIQERLRIFRLQVEHIHENPCVIDCFYRTGEPKPDSKWSFSWLKRR